MKKLENVLKPVTMVLAVLAACYMTLSIWMSMHLSALIPPMIYLILPLAVCMSLLLLCRLRARKGKGEVLTTLSAAILLLVMAVHGGVSMHTAWVEYPTGSPAGFGLETTAMYVLPLAAVGMMEAWRRRGKAVTQEEHWACMFVLALLVVMAVHILLSGLFWVLIWEVRGMEAVGMILAQGAVVRYYVPVWGIARIALWMWENIRRVIHPQKH